MTPFHLAIPTDNLDKARTFYHQLLGCKIGRSDRLWVDFDFFGHQLSVHLKPEETSRISTNEVDGKNIPVRHFGLILKWKDWEKLRDRLTNANYSFVVKPYIRFQNEPGEQATMFIADPANNYLEFKSFKDFFEIFKTNN